MQQERGTKGRGAPSDDERLTRLGRRIAEQRLRVDQTQSQLAHEAGVSRATIQRLEGGASIQLDHLVRVLRALGLADRLDELVPELPRSPLEAIRNARGRQRASGGRGRNDRSSSRAAERRRDEGEWQWGDRS